MQNLIRYHITNSKRLKSFLKFILFLIKTVLFYLPINGINKSKEVMLVKSIKGFTGYYDKNIINPKSNAIVFHRLEGKICNILVANLDSFEEKLIGSTTAWNYQQGAMAEFIDNDRLIYNKFAGNTLSACIINLKTGQTIEQNNFPVQAILPGQEAYVSLNFNRLNNLRPDYGYNKFSDWHETLSIGQDGLWRVNYSGESKLFISLKQLHDLNNLDYDILSKINHVMSTKCGVKILFMFRYFIGASKISVLYTYDFHKHRLKKIRSGVVSHYCWLNESKYAVWFRDRTGGQLAIYDCMDNNKQLAVVRIADGHPVAVEKGGLWYDSYPDILNKVHLRYFSDDLKKTSSQFSVISKPQKSVENRCDAHPKVSGNYLVIDRYENNNRDFGIYKINRITGEEN